MIRFNTFIISICIFFCPENIGAIKKNAAIRSAPISISKTHPQYFNDVKGKPVVLVGDYSWDTFSDSRFDYKALFDDLHRREINFARVWLWKLYEWNPKTGILNLCPYQRMGPGLAADGKPKYDLDKFDPDFFSRLKAVCQAAKDRGIYLQLILLDTWMLKRSELWKLAAQNKQNNINGVNGDPNNTNNGMDPEKGYCSLGNPGAMKYQKAFIYKVAETLNSFDNIFYEIANENYYNEKWELYLCDYIKAIELKMPKQHLTIRRDFPSHHYVVQSWDPLKVHRAILEKRHLNQPLIFDTDWVINKNAKEVRRAAWSALASGANFDYMDGDWEILKDTLIEDKNADLHRQVGFMVHFIKKIKPWEMTPADSLVKQGFAFAMANKESLFAYFPDGGTAMLNLSGMKPHITASWYDPVSGEFGKKFRITAAQQVNIKAPGKQDQVLSLSAY
jgi:hypothetical protein